MSLLKRVHVRRVRRVRTYWTPGDRAVVLRPFAGRRSCPALTVWFVGSFTLTLSY